MDCGIKLLVTKTSGFNSCTVPKRDHTERGEWRVWMCWFHLSPWSFPQRKQALSVNCQELSQQQLWWAFLISKLPLLFYSNTTTLSNLYPLTESATVVLFSRSVFEHLYGADNQAVIYTTLLYYLTPQNATVRLCWPISFAAVISHLENCHGRNNLWNASNTFHE